MKIAVCYNLSFGGAKRAMHELVKRMTQRHAVDFYSVNAEVADGLEIGPFVRRTIVTPGPLPKPGWGMLRGLIGIRHTYRRIAEQINQGEYDLAVISQCQLTQSPYVLRDLRIPSVYYCQESSNRYLEPHVVLRGRLAWVKRGVIWWRYRTVDRPNARSATVICANSRYSVESIYRAYGIYPRYCPLGVDTDFFRPLRLPRQPEVLVVGSLTEAKAPEFVLESVATLARRPLVRFVFNFSHTVSPAGLQKRAEELGVPIALTNMISDNDLIEAYNRSAVVAVASILEPMGFVPLEAMACGTPVIGVAEAGIRETVRDGITGLLTERDPVEFGQALDDLMKDEALRKRMGEAGRQYVMEHRTWEQSYACLESNMQRTIEQYS
jgi:glycosyltransferase involved in cell wall biosynthesis